MDFSRSSGDSSESDCCWDDAQHWDSRGAAFSWLRFSIDSGTGAFGRRLGIHASIFPFSLARSCARVADSTASKSGSLTSIEVILRRICEVDSNSILKCLKHFIQLCDCRSYLKGDNLASVREQHYPNVAIRSSEGFQANEGRWQY